LVGLLIFTLVPKASSSEAKEVEPEEPEILIELSPTVVVEPTPEELVEKFAKQYGASVALAKEIIRCESGRKGEPIVESQRFAKNPYSTASGYFQFINSTWTSTMKRMGLPLDTPKDHPTISIQAGVWLLATDGITHWTESQHCWG
jgi:hypothetical protein